MIGLVVVVVLAAVDFAGLGELLVGLAAVLTVVAARQGHKTRTELRASSTRRTAANEPTFADRVFQRFDALDDRAELLERQMHEDRRLNGARHASNVRRLDVLDSDVGQLREELGRRGGG